MAENIPNQTTTSSGGGAGAITIATTQSTSATAATTIGGGNPSLSSTVATVATAATTIAAAGPAGTVTFTSDNYSTATCIMTPSNTVYAPMNLGTITFPFTFNPQMINGLNVNGQGVSFSLPQGEIEGSFRFTTNDCVFTKTVVRPATQATAATTLATLATTQATLATTMGTNATAATTLGTNATAATTLGTNATAATTQATLATTLGTNATAATTLATAATTLETNATVPTIATTLAPELAYLNIEDNVEGNINVIENGYGAMFIINTAGVEEGTLIDFVFTGDLIMDEGFIRMEYIDGPTQVRVGPSGTAEVKVELTRNFEGYRNETLGITLKDRDSNGNLTGRLSHSVTINAHDNGTAATAATTLATAATTLATPATTLATAATTNATAATSATTETGGGDPSADYTVGPGWTDATNATAATTNATAATTLATVATTSPTLATQATIDDGGGQEEVYQFIDCDEGAGFEPETVQFSLTDWDEATGGMMPDPETTVFSAIMEKCFRFDSIQMGTGARLGKFDIGGCACGVK